MLLILSYDPYGGVVKISHGVRLRSCMCGSERLLTCLHGFVRRLGLSVLLGCRSLSVVLQCLLYVFGIRCGRFHWLFYSNLRSKSRPKFQVLGFLLPLVGTYFWNHMIWLQVWLCFYSKNRCPFVWNFNSISKLDTRFIFAYIIKSSVCWGCRIHRLHL